ncbi:MAG: glycosyltransferase, partial [Oscillospiraceae bacterium]|nr:glycosyltransferase [Oscillospiraceae bacterium]
LWPDLDLTPLIHLADTRPDSSIVLIGRDKGCHLLPELLERRNVHYLGPVSPVDVPDYLAHFDVCLFLLRRGRLYDDVIPTRMFEYLASGRPIVAMLRPEQLEHFPDVVYGAHTVQEFTLLCSRAQEETGTYARDRRREYGKAAAWSQRAEDVKHILESIGLF